jgi:hypothetical protein
VAGGGEDEDDLEALRVSGPTKQGPTHWQPQDHERKALHYASTKKNRKSPELRIPWGNTSLLQLPTGRGAEE